MELFQQFIDIMLHLDKHLTEIVSQYGTLTYIILFAIIFAETGLVVTPFLPGDSLLFATGAVAALPNSPINIHFMVLLLFVAAVLGDTVNYHIGKFIGPVAFSGKFKLLKKSYLEQTQAFFDKHGGKAIIFARFVPIVRTFAPFVGGVGTMNYGKFISFNVIGGAIWVGAFMYMGYFFGNLEYVRKNFTLLILAIIVLSVLPAVFEVIRAKRKPADA